MDYFFLIEFNSRKANVEMLTENIQSLGCEVHYLSCDITGNGIVGVVNAPSLTQRDNFFSNVAYFVQKLNNLPDSNPYGKNASKSDDSDPYDGMATWAYTTVGELVHGLKRLPKEKKENLLPYQIETILRGGVSGTHGG